MINTYMPQPYTIFYQPPYKGITILNSCEHLVQKDKTLMVTSLLSYKLT